MLKRWRRWRSPYIGQVDLDTTKKNIVVWLLLKEGRSPQAVEDLDCLVRRKGDKDRVIEFTGRFGTRTIDRVGDMPPHVLYPDQFGAPELKGNEKLTFVWSVFRSGKRIDLFEHELSLDNGSPRL